MNEEQRAELIRRNSPVYGHELDSLRKEILLSISGCVRRALLASDTHEMFADLLQDELNVLAEGKGRE